MNCLRGLAAALCAASAFAQSPSATNPRYEDLNAVLWMQRSVEYTGVTIETYRTAERTLDRAVRDKHWTAALEQTSGYEDLPPAVVLDLDETVLDNSAFEARLTASGRRYTEQAWGKWLTERRAGTVPGALRFLNMALAAGAAPVYITNRVCNSADPDDPTLGMLRKLRIPVSPERLFCREKNGDSFDKTARRSMVAHHYRIVMLFGDDITDFTWIAPEVRSDDRIKLLTNYESLLGERWFMFPNPMYGSWEQAIGKDKLKALRQ